MLTPILEAAELTANDCDLQRQRDLQETKNLREREKICIDVNSELAREDWSEKTLSSNW